MPNVLHSVPFSFLPLPSLAQTMHHSVLPPFSALSPWSERRPCIWPLLGPLSSGPHVRQPSQRWLSVKMRFWVVEHVVEEGIVFVAGSCALENWHSWGRRSGVKRQFKPHATYVRTWSLKTDGERGRKLSEKKTAKNYGVMREISARKMIN